MTVGRGRGAGAPPQNPRVPELYSTDSPPEPGPGLQDGPPPSSPGLPGDGSYEAVLTALGSIVESAPGTASARGTLRIIQGAVGENPSDGFYAFISVNDVNVPLVSTYKSSRTGSNSFSVSIPDRLFHVTLDPQTEPSVVDGMERILRWFTAWEGTCAPQGNSPVDLNAEGASESMDAATAAAVAGFAPGSSAELEDPTRRTQSALDRAGIKGAGLVTKYGEKLNTSLKARADASVAAQADKPTRNVKLGGQATASALGTAKTVVGAGAGLAATAIDKVSSVIGDGLANNKVMTSMRAAPEASSKRKAHDLLVSGAMAVGRVYIAADNQGKLIFETVGDGAGRVAGAKYGSEAETAARAVGHIGLDSYRIIRFPQKMVASSLVKGGLKGATQAHAGGVTSGVHMSDPGAYAVGTGASSNTKENASRYYSDSAM